MNCFSRPFFTRPAHVLFFLFLSIPTRTWYGPSPPSQKLSHVTLPAPAPTLKGVYFLPLEKIKSTFFSPLFYTARARTFSFFLHGPETHFFFFFFADLFTHPLRPIRYCDSPKLTCRKTLWHYNQGAEGRGRPPWTPDDYGRTAPTTSSGP